MRKLRNFILLLSVLLPINSLAVNYVGSDNVLSLEGINGIFIAIEGIDEHATRSGITASMLTNEVQSALSKSEIKILSDKEVINTPGRPVLIVSVNVFRNINDTSYSTEVSLNQIVLMQRNTKILAHIPTWSIKSAGMASNDSAGQEILKYILLSLDEFTKAYKRSK